MRCVTKNKMFVMFITSDVLGKVLNKEMNKE